MHEYGLMEAILRDALAEADRRRGTVLGIRVGLGELSGISAASLETAFLALTKGTSAEGARLEIADVAGMVQCDACGLSGGPRELGLEVSHEEPLLLCPRCGFILTATQGHEVALREVTLQLEEGRQIGAEDRNEGPARGPTSPRQE